MRRSFVLPKTRNGEKSFRRFRVLSHVKQTICALAVTLSFQVLAQYANVLQQDVTQFRELQGVVASFLGSNPSSPGRLMYVRCTGRRTLDPNPKC